MFIRSEIRRIMGRAAQL